MTGETNLENLLRMIKPQLADGDFVFCTVNDPSIIAIEDVLLFFREPEGVTVILRKERADRLGWAYQFIASWITLTVHSSLEAVGLTAAFSKALAEHGISCNVVAGYFHDHIFVDKKDTEKAMAVLKQLAEGAILK